MYACNKATNTFKAYRTTVSTTENTLTLYPVIEPKMSANINIKPRMAIIIILPDNMFAKRRIAKANGLVNIPKSQLE